MPNAIEIENLLSKIGICAANLNENLFSATFIIPTPTGDDPLVRRTVLSERKPVVEGWKFL